MSTIAGDELPYVAGTRDEPLVTRLSDGLLAYVAFMLNKLSPAVDRILPRDESNPQQAAFEMVPAANMFKTDPRRRRLRHMPLPTPSLWLWWHPPAPRKRITAAHVQSIRNYRFLWILPEQPESGDLLLDANIWEMIDNVMCEGSDDQWQPGFAHAGADDGTSLVASVSDHDSIDWEYMGGLDIPRIGASEGNESDFGEKTSGRDYAAFAGVIEAHLKLAVHIDSKFTAEADSEFDITSNGLAIMTGAVPAVEP